MSKPNESYIRVSYGEDGNPQIPYLNDKDVHKLVERILEDGVKDDGRD
jgi:hypothetical protein